MICILKRLATKQNQLAANLLMGMAFKKGQITHENAPKFTRFTTLAWLVACAFRGIFGVDLPTNVLGL
jgi:hypothetical protein